MKAFQGLGKDIYRPVEWLRNMLLKPFKGLFKLLQKAV